MTSTRRKNFLPWTGVLIALLGFFSYFLFFARFPALRDFPWLNLPVVLLGVGLSVVGVLRAWRRPAIYRGRILGSLAGALSFCVGLLFCFYIFFLSNWLPTAETARTLKQAPDFTLETMSGETVQLGVYRGRKILLVFYRGYW